MSDQKVLELAQEIARQSETTAVEYTEFADKCKKLAAEVKRIVEERANPQTA